MKKNPVTWFEIYVDDITRAQKFYETVLNISMEKMGAPNADEYKIVVFPWKENAPDAAGALVWMPHMKAGGNSTIVYFTCDDCAVEQSRVEAAGGKVLQPKFSIEERGFCALCIDVEGNYFGLHSLK